MDVVGQEKPEIWEECLGRSGQLEKCRTVTRFKDDDHMEWALFGAGPDGKEIQVLRIEYARRK